MDTKKRMDDSLACAGLIQRLTLELYEMDIQKTRAVMDQLISFLTECEPTCYTKKACISSSTIGQHVRHVLDHIDCLITAHDSLVVDYSKRKRQQLIETRIDSAIHQARWLASELHRLPSGCTPVDVTETDETGITHSQSSIARELEFINSHSIHHYAMIKLLYQSFGYTLDDHFGVAPSTIAYQYSQPIRR